MKILSTTILLTILVATRAPIIADEDVTSTKIRIGTYDNRAIAIAFAASPFNPVKAKMEAYEKAKADGDQQQMKELEAWGKKLQRQLHRQGFSTVPVSDLLQHVRGKLPDVAKTMNVVAIVRASDYAAPGVELVDVTDELVELFDPSEKTLKNIQSIRPKAPVDLDEIDHDH